MPLSHLSLTFLIRHLHLAELLNLDNRRQGIFIDLTHFVNYACTRNTVITEYILHSPDCYSGV